MGGSGGKSVPLLVLRAGPDEREALLSVGHPFFASRAGRNRIVVVLTDDTKGLYRPLWSERGSSPRRAKPSRKSIRASTYIGASPICGTYSVIEGEHSPVIQRRLTDGTAYRIVKVPHQPAGLEQQLDRIGWRIKVHPTFGPFYWGSGNRPQPAQVA